MTYFKKTFALTESEKKEVSEMTGKIMLYILEGRDIGYMSENLHLSPRQIKCNINEILYTLKKYVGWKQYLRILFWK